MHNELTIRILKFVAILLVVYLVLYIASKFIEVAIAAVIAGILYYLSLPVVTFMESKGVYRIAAVLLVLIMYAALIIILMLYLVPVIIAQLTDLAEDVPAIIDSIESWVAQVRDSLGGRVTEQQFDMLVNEITSRAGGAIGATASAIITGLSNIVSVLLAVIIGVVAAFYLLKDRDQIHEYIRRYIPEESKQTADGVLGGTSTVLSGFLRGQIIVALIVGTLVGIALLILGIPFAFLLAVIAAIFELIPYLGPILAAIPAVLLALAISPLTALFVAIVFLVIQQIEGLVLSPRIVGAQVHLHPVTVIFAVLIGRQVIGVIGIFLAIPIAGIAKVLVEQFLLPEEEKETVEEEQQQA